MPLKDKTLGERLLRARKAKRWSQTQLGNKVGVTRSAVSQWEKGHLLPTQRRFEKLSEHFGVSLDWLQKGKGPEPDLKPNDDTTKLLTNFSDTCALLRTGLRMLDEHMAELQRLLSER